MPANPSTLAAAVGHAVKIWRQQHRKTANDIALAMNQLGLDWTRSSVATLENGARDLTAGELAVLPVALSRAVGRPVPLYEVLEGIDPEARVRLAEGCTASLHAAAHLLASAVATTEDWWDSIAGVDEQSVVEGADATVRVGTVAITVTMPPPVGVGELERRTARRLGLTPQEVAEAAVQLFGQTLTAERDRRVDEQLPGDASPRTVQALRGHVSRQLLANLRAFMHAKPSTGGADGARPDVGEREATSSLSRPGRQRAHEGL